MGRSLAEGSPPRLCLQAAGALPRAGGLLRLQHGEFLVSRGGCGAAL